MRRRSASWFQQHERSLTIFYLVLVAAAIAPLLVPQLRTPIANLAQRVIIKFAQQPIADVTYGEALVAAGKYEDAVSYLSSLDQSFPARTVRHALDVERERVLRGLGQAYEGLGRKRLALGSYRRAVRFDPRNVENHFALAQAARRFDEPDEAAEHFAYILSVHPSHLPSVNALVQHAFDAADYHKVVALFQTYLDSIRVDTIVVELGARQAAVRVVVAGHKHNVRAVFDQPVTADGDELRIRSRTGPIAIEHVRLDFAFHGEYDVPQVAASRSNSTTASVQSSASSWSIRLPEKPFAVKAVDLTLKAPKKVDVQTWDMVETSYRNTLNPGGLETARARIYLGAFEPDQLR